ncbi:IclR family transcriptional regulator [Sporosarcina sp. Marseille-Q4063]|uniref:IclR family transcriptional regulator n=1 Tax=Sporosarcina sp. Marseille-Q4063 TaxID=2810514 RepID=UPI001BAF7533|nr:IclR family transcriptional regulator [Sporosarcina sp. Marseille-Q4063]QUW21274.1 IclR family transcriptional regulator [Sporosarcina sp. Marseille-Q4063]
MIEINKYKNQSLERAFSILNLFTQVEPELSFNEIDKKINLTKATLYRFLGDLEVSGFIEQDIFSKKYRLGLKLLELGTIVQDNIEVRKKAFPFLEDIRKRTNENVNLGILENGEVVYVERLETARLIRMNFRVGSRVPAHCSSIGKVLLSYASQEEQSHYLETVELEMFTEQTITSEVEFNKELIKTRNQGYSISDREFIDEIRTIAFPIFNHLNEAVASFNISGPHYRLPYELIQTKILPMLLDTGEKISKEIGFSGNYTKIVNLNSNNITEI